MHSRDAWLEPPHWPTRGGSTVVLLPHWRREVAAALYLVRKRGEPADDEVAGQVGDERGAAGEREQRDVERAQRRQRGGNRAALGEQREWHEHERRARREARHEPQRRDALVLHVEAVTLSY
jgi:hypothetical protein